jgi:hypothetical protein
MRELAELLVHYRATLSPSPRTNRIARQWDDSPSPKKMRMSAPSTGSPSTFSAM